MTLAFDMGTAALADAYGFDESKTWLQNRHALSHMVALRDGITCAYCGGNLYCHHCNSDVWEPRRRATLDHRLPRVASGSDELDNLVLACRSCNSRKSTSAPEVLFR